MPRKHPRAEVNQLIQRSARPDYHLLKVIEPVRVGLGEPLCIGVVEDMSSLNYVTLCREPIPGGRLLPPQGSRLRPPRYINLGTQWNVGL